jgi:hypothetical protein
MIAGTGTMLVEASSQVPSIDNRRQLGTAAKHLVMEHASRTGGDPFTDRRGKTAFRQLPQSARELPAGKLPEQRLAGSPLLFQRCRNAKCQFDDAAIQQRAPNLQAVSHAHPIDFHERIVGQVNLEIRVTSALDGVR